MILSGSVRLDSYGILAVMHARIRQETVETARPEAWRKSAPSGQPERRLCRVLFVLRLLPQRFHSGLCRREYLASIDWTLLLRETLYP